YIASAGSDKTVQIWEAATGQRISTYNGHLGEVQAVVEVTWSPDGTYIASRGTKGLRIWDVAKKRNVFIHQHSATVHAVAWSPDGKFIASCGDKAVQVREATNGDHVITYKKHTTNTISVSWSSTGKYIASADDKTLQIWEAETGNCLFTETERDTVLATWSPQ